MVSVSDKNFDSQPDGQCADILVSAEHLTTIFLSVIVPFPSSSVHLRDAIEAELRSHGEPLRWAITSIDVVQQTAQIEAVVTQTRARP